MWSRTDLYALRAMVYLAVRSPHTCTTHEIAAATRVPQPYLSKVLRLLVRAGLVRSHRGLRGGIELAKPPDEMTVQQILAAVDPRSQLHADQIGFDVHGTRLNQLHRHIAGVNAMFEKVFETTTLLELIEPHPNMLSGGTMPATDRPQAISAVAFTDEVPQWLPYFGPTKQR